jgi:hypothetical protein
MARRWAVQTNLSPFSEWQSLQEKAVALDSKAFQSMKILTAKKNFRVKKSFIPLKTVA